TASYIFFCTRRRRHTRSKRDWSSDVCSSDLNTPSEALPARYLHDAGYRLRLRKGLEATFEVKNLGDARTYDYVRYPLPGRSYHRSEERRVGKACMADRTSVV